MRNRLTRIALIFAGWALLGLVLTIELYFNGMAANGMKFGFVDLAISQFGRALMWAILVPAILRLRMKVPLRSGRWIGGISFHLLMSFLLMAGYYLGRLWLYSTFFHPKMGTVGFWSDALLGFYGHNLVDMAYYWGVLAFGHGLEIYQKYKDQELKAAQLEARLVETELKALREQLRPHFLFNTLNTVAVLVREEKKDEAVALLAHLGALLRLSLDPERSHEIPLREEMAYLERYLEIQRARFTDRLTVAIDVEPEALSARIPNLLLQPIVENAILHGISPKAGPGRIEVTGRVADGRLHLEVRDDGPGLPCGARARDGIGLSNTRERLAKIYGPGGNLTLTSAPGGGVAVHIVLPCRT
jgi:signal transduction histidine kinase